MDKCLALGITTGKACRRLSGLAVLGGLLLSLCAGPVFAAGALACNPADPDQVRLQISVSGMRTTKGTVNVTIYPDDAAHFLDGRYKLAREHFPVVLPVTHACFAFAAPGYYAVALFGDENENGHFDTNFLGIPVEGYGFSNNPTLYFGPPKLRQVRFAAHRGDNLIAVTMKYY